MMKIVKVPSNYGGLEKADGVELAPDHIERELKEIYSNEDYKRDEIVFENIDRKRLEDGNEIVQNYSGDVFLGGDHSVSYYSYKGYSQNKDETFLVVFDAHPDVYEMFEFPSHQDWLKRLIDDGLVKKENVVIIGVRNADKKEIAFLRENKIKFYGIDESCENKEGVCDAVTETASRFSKVYISVDIDVLDPAFAPGTGYCEPGGMSSRELIYYIKRLKKMKNLKRYDIVEVNPKKDINNITSRMAAKLIVEMM